MSEELVFSAIELDALQESMNIGFGKAAAALSEVIDLHVVLSVPKISMATKDALAGLICGELGDPSTFALVEQRFRGRISGTGFLLVSELEGRKLTDLFGGPGALAGGADPALLERDVLFEVGNILIGACVGKIAELLGDGLTYLPPRVIGAPISRALLESRIDEPAGLGLVFRTLFHFDAMDVDGLLFLITSEEAASFIKTAVGKSIEGLV